MWFQKSIQIKKNWIDFKKHLKWISVSTYDNDNYDDSDLQWILDHHCHGRHSHPQDPGDHLRRRRQHVRWPCQRMRGQAWRRNLEDCHVSLWMHGRRQFARSQMDWVHWQLVRRTATWTWYNAPHVQQWSHGGGAWRHVEPRGSHLICTRRDTEIAKPNNQKKTKKTFFLLKCDSKNQYKPTKIELI